MLSRLTSTACGARRLQLDSSVVAIGERLDEFRRRAGWSQADLARKLDMLPQSLNKILKGHVRDPGFETVARIATVIGVSLDELMRSEAEELLDRRATGRLTEADLAPSAIPFEIVDFQAGMVEVPVDGEVAAGHPIDDPIEGDSVLVPAEFAPREGEKLLRARGDSMIEFGIDDGDYVVVEPRKGGVAASGEIVIGWLNDGLTVKRWVRKGGRKVLQGSSRATTFELGPDDHFELRAIVRRSFKIRQHPKISG